MIRRIGMLTLVACGCGLATNGIGTALDDASVSSIDGSTDAPAESEDAAGFETSVEASFDAPADGNTSSDASLDVVDAADVKLDVMPDAPPDVIDAGVPGTISSSAALGILADRTSPTDQGLTTDGQNDGAVRITVVGPINALLMVTTNGGGNTTGNSQWDTLVLTDPIPQSITTSHNVGSDTWIMAVYDGANTRLNDANGRISLGAGTHVLTLYGSQNGQIQSGQTFRVWARVPGINGDTWVGGPVFAW